MPYRWPRISQVPPAGGGLVIAWFIALIVACGAQPAPEVVDKQQQPGITPLPMVNTELTPTAKPTASQPALPTPIAVPTGIPQHSSVNPERGAINVGISELGSLEGAADPKELASPALGHLNMTVYETLVVSAPKRGSGAPAGQGLAGLARRADLDLLNPGRGSLSRRRWGGTKRGRCGLDLDSVHRAG